MSFEIPNQVPPSVTTPQDAVADSIQGADESLTSLFTEDLTKVDLSAKLMAPAIIDFIISEMKLIDSKDQMSKLIAITLATEFATKGTKGESFKPGRKLTHNISLKLTDKDGNDRREMIAQDLKRLRIAAGFGDTGSFGSLDQYIGKKVRCTVAIEVDKSGQYADKNVIRKWEPAK